MISNKFKYTAYYMKELFKAFLPIVLPGLIIIIVVVLFLVAADFHYKYFDLLPAEATVFHSSHSAHSVKASFGELNIAAFSAICMAVLTGSLVFVAWFQMTGINKNTKADFLLRLDTRYGSSSILKARRIIQRYYREAKKMAVKDCQSEDLCRAYVAKKICECGESGEPSDMSDYIYLLNLLDFLETISFYANDGAIKDSDIRDLMGCSLSFYYDIFKARINQRRDKYKDQSYYSEFEKLASRMFFEKTCLK